MILEITIVSFTILMLWMCEQNVRISRMTFNDTVTKYTRLLRQIPTCFVANSMGFSKRDYLETPETKAEMPSMRR